VLGERVVGWKADVLARPEKQNKARQPGWHSLSVVNWSLSGFIPRKCGFSHLRFSYLLALQPLVDVHKAVSKFTHVICHNLT
jgi:hypothetical protein